MSRLACPLCHRNLHMDGVLVRWHDMIDSGVTEKLHLNYVFILARGEMELFFLCRASYRKHPEFISEIVQIIMNIAS
jgi:hypothetical protein